jgi:hypothetical protein
MSDNQPTELEDRAYMESVRQFVEHLKRYVANRDAVKQLERYTTQTAMTASVDSPKPAQGNPIQTTDGTPWPRSVALFDDTSLCCRPAAGATEYAVVKYSPTTGRNEILNRGMDATEVLRAFVQEQRQALQTRKEAVAAQVKEFLAEKYPGHDLTRVVESFMHKFTTQRASERQAIRHDHQQKRGYWIGV